MKKEFETPVIEVVDFSEEIITDGKSQNVPEDGWQDM